MITIKKIKIIYNGEETEQKSKECYAIISYADSVHYCSTVVCGEGRFVWLFDREMVRLSLFNL